MPERKYGFIHLLLCSILQRFDYFLLLWWVGVHCGIYKSSNNMSNISYLNSPSLLLSFVTPSPHSWNNLNRYHFFPLHICVHSICTILTLLLPFPPPPLSIGTDHSSPSPQDLFQASCSLIM
jgi:hypothetical protein